VLFVIGGGLGSREVNNAVADAVPHLLAEFSDLHVIHATGRANETEVKNLYNERMGLNEKSRLEVRSYLNDVYRYSGAADLVITRAGATNLAEFALQGKACVVIPSGFLAAGHQLKNASYLQQQNAAAVLTEKDLADDPNRLARQVSDLLRDDKTRQQLAKGLARFAKPDATADLAKLILDQAK
jgi:UDP-N-acetylglucosamine--N-acetylmuramyl-(pentapeptide) pyrophosphoryl-undecaprenol N-acetylglucosamine transferase